MAYPFCSPWTLFWPVSGERMVPHSRPNRRLLLLQSQKCYFRLPIAKSTPNLLSFIYSQWLIIHRSPTPLGTRSFNTSTETTELTKNSYYQFSVQYHPNFLSGHCLLNDLAINCKPRVVAKKKSNVNFMTSRELTTARTTFRYKCQWMLWNLLIFFRNKNLLIFFKLLSNLSIFFRFFQIPEFFQILC